MLAIFLLFVAVNAVSVQEQFHVPSIPLVFSCVLHAKSKTICLVSTDDHDIRVYFDRKRSFSLLHFKLKYRNIYSATRRDERVTRTRRTRIQTKCCYGRPESLNTFL